MGTPEGFKALAAEIERLDGLGAYADSGRPIRMLADGPYRGLEGLLEFVVPGTGSVYVKLRERNGDEVYVMCKSINEVEFLD